MNKIIYKCRLKGGGGAPAPTTKKQMKRGERRNLLLKVRVRGEEKESKEEPTKEKKIKLVV
jgi:hypothetical protein